MSVVRQLYQLQLADSEWDENRRRLEEVERSLGESPEVIRAREAVLEAEKELQQCRAQVHSFELEIGTVSAKLKANQERLYGGKVRNPKELGGLEEEAKALSRRRSELEDRQLELMICLDDRKAELAERIARLRQIEAGWREEQAVLGTEKERLESHLAELDEMKKELRAQVKTADLGMYDDLRASLSGRAVALLKRGVCQVCGVDVPTGLAQAIQRGEGLHFCPVCGRLLYGGG